MLASEVMESARSHLNDILGQIFNNDILLPYLRTAYDELQSEMQENGLPITFEASSALAITAGATTISTSSIPPLPLNLIEPMSLYEKDLGETRWHEMDRIYTLPFTTDQRANLIVWFWSEDEIKLAGSTANRDVMIRYMKSMPELNAESTDIPVRGAKNYLSYKTAAEAAEDIGQNRNRADRLESKAGRALSKFLNIKVKGLQGRPVRRRPYGSGRSWHTPLPW